MALEIAGVTAGHDRAIAELRGGERAWARTPLAARRELLLELAAAAAREATNWVETAARIKELDPASPLVGEEWISGPYALLSSVSALAETLLALSSGESPLAGTRPRTAPGAGPRSRCSRTGSSTGCCFPATGLRSGRAPGVSRDDVRATAGLAQRLPSAPAASRSSSARATSRRSRRWT